MPQDEGRGVVDKVEAAVAIHVMDVNALTSVNVDRERVDKNPGARIAAGQNFSRAFEEALRVRVLIAVVRDELVEREHNQFFQSE